MSTEGAVRRGRARAHLSAGRIDKGSALPMYDQLERIIRAAIADGILKPGELLPGELHLCELYGVSRTVVRQALAQLENARVIVRVKGKGTFVAPQKTTETLAGRLAGLFEEVASRNGHVRSTVLRLEREPASEFVAEQLDLAVGTPVVVLERLRFVDDERWSLSTTWMPEAIGRHVFGVDLTNSSLYALLESRGVKAETGIRSIEAALTDAREGQLLGIGPGKPVLQLRSRTFDAHRRPVEYFEALHRGDRSRFEFHLEASTPRDRPVFITQ